MALKASGSRHRGGGPRQRAVRDHLDGRHAVDLAAYAAHGVPASLVGKQLDLAREVPLERIGNRALPGAVAVLLGVMVAPEARLPLVLAALPVGFFAVFHGHAHGTGLPAGQSRLMYSMGFVTATGCLHGVGIAIGVIHKWPAGRIALRLAGAAVALAGVGFTWRALA